MQFDLKTQPWFIRVANEQEFNSARDFVQSKGFDFIYSESWYAGLVGICHDSKDDDGVYRLHSGDDVSAHQEIKITFKTVIDFVSFPQMKTEQQLKIEQLEATIARAAEEIKQLKEMK